jgi:hypothetical protein
VSSYRLCHTLLNGFLIQCVQIMAAQVYLEKEGARRLT